MIAILFLGASLLHLALLLIGLFAAVKFIDYGLHYLADSGAPDFWAPDSFWAWVIGIVLTLLVIIFLRKVADVGKSVFNFLPMLLISSLFNTSRQITAVIFLIAYVIALVVIGVMVSAWVTSAFFDYTTAHHQHLTTFFQHGNTWAYVATFTLVYYILFSASGKEEEWKTEEGEA